MALALLLHSMFSLFSHAQPPLRFLMHPDTSHRLQCRLCLSSQELSDAEVQSQLAQEGLPKHAPFWTCHFELDARTSCLRLSQAARKAPKTQKNAFFSD